MFTEKQKHLLDKLCEIDGIDSEIRSVLDKTNRNINEIKKVEHDVSRITRNIIKYYEALFPWLPEFVGEELDDLIEQFTRNTFANYLEQH